MELCTKVKANSINNLSDGRYFATFAEWVGFNFNPQNPNGIDLPTAVMIMGWLAGPRIVGEFDDLPPETINNIAQELQLDTIQTDLDLSGSYLLPIISTVIRRIVILPTTTAANILEVIENAKGVSYFLLDFQTHQLTWDSVEQHASVHLPFLQRLCSTHPILLAALFTSANVLSIVNGIGAAGIALLGGNELQPGIRLFDDVQDIIEQLEIF